MSRTYRDRSSRPRQHGRSEALQCRHGRSSGGEPQSIAGRSGHCPYCVQARDRTRGDDPDCPEPRPAWPGHGRAEGGPSDLRPRFARLGEEFRCRHCRLMVGPVPSGGRHRNHCPACLFSRHVDRSRPGDRASDCGGSMAPVAVTTRLDGEYLVVHACQTCGAVRQCRVAADDDWARVMALPLRERACSNREREDRLDETA